MPMSIPDERLSATRWLLRASKPHAPISGTRSVIVDAQRALLAATVAAGVPRFVPSDWSADYRSIDVGSNRNFELRREFAADVDAASYVGERRPQERAQPALRIDGGLGA